MPIYDDLLRRVVNEINVGGKQIDNENDDDDNDNFMDDDAPSDTAPPADDTPAPEPAADDTGDDDTGDDDANFMDDDGDDTGDDTGDDGTGDDDANFMDDDEGGDDDTGNDEGSDEGGNDDTGDDDANFMDDDEGGGEGDDTGDDEGSDEGEGDDSGEDGDGDGEDYDLDKIEDELFSSLTPEQIAIKNHELKNQFIELYSLIGTTLVRINDIPKSNENINILKFITEKLLELREMIDYNITTAYSTRTYIENNIIYQQCIATINTIADIINNIPNVNGGDSSKEHEDEEQEKKDSLGEPVVPDETETHSSLDLSDINVSEYREESANAYNDLF